MAIFKRATDNGNRPSRPATKPVSRRVLRREVEWATKFQVEGERDLSWRECTVIDVSRGGAGVVLYDTSPEEIQHRRLVVEVAVPPAMLRLRGDVRHASLTDDGALRVGIAFGALSSLERDMLDSLIDREAEAARR
jgi:hypothetical protein